jgi:hypothetical protein
MEVLKDPIESVKRLTPRGSLEETEGYKEFKREEYLESPEFAEKKEVFKEEGIDWLAGEEDSLKIELANIENAKFNQYGLTKVRAEELVDILEREGVVLPDGMTEEKTLELLSSFDKVPMGQNPVGTAQPEYRAFVDTLKSGSQNPDTFQSVVTDLTANTDETIQSVIEGTYTPEVVDVSTAADITDPSAYPDIQQWEEDLGVGDGVFTAEELENMPASAAITLPTGDPAQIDADWGTYSTSGEDVLEGSKLQRSRDIQTTSTAAPEVSEDDPIFQSMQEGWEAGADQAGQEAAPMLASAGPLSDAPIDVSADAPDVEIPDAKPGLGRFAGKAFNAANLQTGQQIFNIGKTLTDEDATGEDKAVATVQGTKLLADLAAKHAGQKTASQIGAKAASDYFAKKGLQEGVKQTGKQAVGTIAGGALGGYTMVTEGKEAVESWEEKDYDEAILHGIGSAAGGLQTVGAGMMMSVAGAPLGAILYGVGTAASVITSGALFLEGLFGGDGAAPAAPVLPKQRFDASRYINTLRQRERR